MGDVFGYTAYCGHQSLYTIKHGVNILRQMTIFVPSLANRNALRKIALKYLLCD